MGLVNAGRSGEQPAINSPYYRICLMMERKSARGKLSLAVSVPADCAEPFAWDLSLAIEEAMAPMRTTLSPLTARTTG